MDVEPARSAPSDGEDQTGKSGAGAEVEPGLGLGREVEKLRRIDDVPVPDLGQGRRPDEVLDRLPAAKLALEQLELLECFT